MFTKIGHIRTLKTDSGRLSSSGNNRLVPLTTHFIANALIALITCDCSFHNQPWPGLAKEVDESVKNFTPANNVLSFCHQGFAGLNMFHK